jgi:integrase/recombinase XerD
MNPNPSLKTYLQKHYSKLTVKAYASDINIYTSNFPTAATAKNKDIMKSLTAIRNRYPNPKTLTKFLCSIKVYYQFLVETGKRKDNPAQSIYLKDKLNTAIQLQDLFTNKELENLLTLHENKDYPNDSLKQRDKIILTLLIYQGLQIGELERLNTEDINLQQGTINIKPSLITNGRELALKPNQILLFQTYLNEIRLNLSSQNPNPTNSFLLSSTGIAHHKHEISKLITANFKDHYKPRKLNCQTIRQSVITNLLKDAHDVRVVQVFAGHKSPSSTERYQQTSVEELKTIIQNFHPMR